MGKPCWAFIYIQVREGKSRAPGAGGVLALAVVRQGVREEDTAGWSVGNTEKMSEYLPGDSLGRSGDEWLESWASCRLRG